MTTPKKHPVASHEATTPHADPAPAAADATPAPTPTPTSFATPPPLSSMPAAPAGFPAPAKGTFRGIVPITEEETSLPNAIQDLGKITDYSLFVGAPPLALLIQILTLAGEWTKVRNSSENFDGYAATQEGDVWTAARTMLEAFAGAFAQAQKAQPSLATELPGLVKFLGIESVVAQRGASTKRANKQAEAAGERPTHGKVGRQRQKAAAKAALAAADASAENAPTGSTGATGGAQANGATHS